MIMDALLFTHPLDLSDGAYCAVAAQYHVGDQAGPPWRLPGR
jgi:hypothetical protein